MSEGAIRVGCFVAGVASVYVVARIYRNRIRESIASSVTGKLSASISTIVPGVPIVASQDMMNAIATNVSYPVADGVLEGLMIG